MKKMIFAALLLLAFCAGYAVNQFTNNFSIQKEKKRVTSIGGVFFKSKDPAKLREWYSKHLGLNVDKYGSVFAWYHGADSTKKGFTQWSVFNAKTKYFLPSQKEFMINYRVEDLVWLVDQLKKEGVMITDTIQSFDYGKFIHLMDIDSNKIELWEPNDLVYGKMGSAITK